MRATTLDDADIAYAAPIRARPKGVRAALGMGVGACIILAAAALLSRPAAPNANTVVETPLAAPAPAKIAAKASMSDDSTAVSHTAALDTDAPGFEREKKVVSLGEAQESGEHVDSMSVGQFAAGASYLRVDIHPELSPSATDSDFFLDLTRHARGVGLNVAKIGQRATLSTRFGNFEAADIRLSQPGGEGAEASERACLAARLIDPKAPLEIAAIACGSAARPLDRVAFACVLDHVNYSGASDNRALNDFFLNAELARGKGCANVSRDDLTASIPRKASGAKPAAQSKKSRTVATRAPAVHPDAMKN